MKRLKQIILALTGKTRPPVRAVAMIVPHGGADASRDFESALEMLQSDDRARELWRGKRIRIPVAPAS